MLALPAASPAFCVWRAAVCCWRNVLHFASSRQPLGLVVGAPCCRLHSAAIGRLSASGALCCHLRSASSRRLLGLAVGAHCCCLSCTSGRWLCAARALCSRLHSVSGRQLLRVAVGAPCCRLHSASASVCYCLDYFPLGAWIPSFSSAPVGHCIFILFAKATGSVCVVLLLSMSLRSSYSPLLT